MAAPTFASPAELRELLKDPGLSDIRARLVLEGISDDIRTGLGWSVTEETGVVVTLDGSGDALLFLPTAHLTAVVSVVEDGITLVFGVDFDWTERGVLRRLAGSALALKAWTFKPRSVVATINHGYPPGQVPSVFRTVCLDYSLLAIANPVGVRSVQIGPISQSNDPQTTLGAIKASDDPRLDRYWTET